MWNLALVLGRCWCQSRVGSTCVPSKKQFAFPRATTEPQHYVTVSQQRWRSHSLVGLVGHDNPDPRPWHKQFFVLDLQSVGATLEPVFLPKNQFYAWRNVMNWLKTGHWLRTSPSLDGEGLKYWCGLGHNVAYCHLWTQTKPHYLAEH